MGRCVRGVLAVAGAAAVALLGLSVARYQSNERRTTCLGMVYNLAATTSMYLMDWQETPNPRTWSDQFDEYMESANGYRCPNAKGLRCAYAFNTGVTATRAGHHFPFRPKPDPNANPDDLIIIFESDRGWNAHGGRELLPVEPRHMGGDVYGFLDGHSDWVKRGDPSARIQWEGAASRPAVARRRREVIPAPPQDGSRRRSRQYPVP